MILKRAQVFDMLCRKLRVRECPIRWRHCVIDWDNFGVKFQDC